jgi:large subunit ribosomal protein L30
MSEKKIKVTQVRSSIRNTKRQKASLQALGLGKIGRAAEQTLTPSVMGMLRSVENLIVVEQISKK